MMKDVSRMKGNYHGEQLYGKAQDILWDEEFYEYARYPKVPLYTKLKNEQLRDYRLNLDHGLR